MKRLLLVILAIILLVMSISCTSTPSYPPQRNGGEGQEPSWAYIYTNMADMCTHSDVIAIGSVKELIGTVEAGAMLYKSFWNFKVDEIRKGDKVKKLTILQTGSPDVPGSDFKSDPLFLPGDRYLLFLKEGSEGNYYFHPQGRFFIWHNRVYSMNYILSNNVALPPVPGLNCNGDDLSTIKDKIAEIVDSVQLIFTQYKARVPGDVMRYEAGMTVDIYANLSTGRNGPGKVTYKVKREELPAGIDVSIRPAEFEAEPYTEYESIVIILIAPDVPSGTYYIPVEYDFEGVGSGIRTITLHINPVNHDEVVSREELIERGLLPQEGSEE
jgi:hypothetical protein